MIKEKLEKSILGFALGDALGVPVEFMSKNELASNPVTDFREFGTYKQPKGAWSYDTALTLATMDAFSKKGPNYDLVADNFVSWLKNAKFTANDIVFDCDNVINDAISRRKKGTKAIKCGEKDNKYDGNGALVRMFPIAFYCCHMEHDKEIQDIVFKTASITHASKVSRFSSLYLTQFIINLLKGMSKKEAYLTVCETFSDKAPEELSRILEGNIDTLAEDEIRTSSKAHETLEASIWTFLTTDCYKEAVLKSVNLGGDTNSISAIVGGLSAIYYDDKNGIPNEWKDIVQNKTLIEQITKSFSKVVLA